MKNTPLGSNLQKHEIFEELSTGPGSKTSNNKGTQRTLDEPMHNLNVSGKDGLPALESIEKKGALESLEKKGFVACKAFDKNGKEEPQQPGQVIIARQYETAVQREIRQTAERAGSATPTPSNDQPNEQRGLYSDAPPLWDNFAGT